MRLSPRNVCRVTQPALLCCWMLTLALAWTSAAQAEFTVSKLFGDGMVLQRDKPVKVWGWATPGELVKATFAGQDVGAEADENGKWVVAFEPMPASFESRTMEINCKSGGVAINDVLVGEVWICGGQSNMEWTLRGSLNWDIEMQSADAPAVRYLSLPNVASNEVARDIPLEEEGGWRVCMPESVDRCTAVGYYFALRLHRYLKVPVGIIDNSWGGTTAQHWCSRKTLEKISEMKPDLEAFDKSVKAWIDGGEETGAKQRYEADLVKWEAERKLAESEGRRAPGRPNMRNYEDPRTKRQPSGMYNTLLKPMAGLAVRGVLFYQGENNSFGGAWKPFYRTYPSIVADWRAVFGDSELPFGLIQIAGWSNRRTMTYDQNHHTNVVRELQFKTWQQTPGTGLIVTYDANSDGNIHPKNKQTVGERSARWALAEVYGATQPNSNKTIEWRGPVYQSYKVEGDKIIVQFDPATAGGLRLKLDTAQGFYIAGKDREFHVANASVDGRAATATIWSDAVKEPVAARYAISNLPNGTLMNGKELPAYPFRTDTWPMTPHYGTDSYHADRENPVVEEGDELEINVEADAAQQKPLKVFILSGQSNMTGRGALGDATQTDEDQPATLAKFVQKPENRAKYAFLTAGPEKTDNGWTIRDDVYISLGEWPRKAEGEEGYSPWSKEGKFGPYYGGRRNNGFGPELAIGHMLGDKYDETVVLIKIAYGGNSLAGNFRPPSSGGALGDKYPKLVETVKLALDNLDQIVPGYTDQQGFELVGMFWNQGLSDMTDPAASEYEQNLVNLISDLRKEWNAPNLPVAIGVTGNWGFELTELKENKEISDEQRKSFIDGITKVVEAQFAVAKRPEFAGNVITAETRAFWRPRPEHGGRGTETHWMANGESYWLIGEAMGAAMLELLETAEEG